MALFGEHRGPSWYILCMCLCLCMCVCMHVYTCMLNSQINSEWKKNKCLSTRVAIYSQGKEKDSNSLCDNE